LVGFGRSVRLALQVVPWHKFNLVRFGPVNRAGAAPELVRLPLSDVPGIPNRECEMKHQPSIAELREKLGAPSSETVEAVRLLKAFLKLGQRQRFEVIELVEQLADDPRPDRRLS